MQLASFSMRFRLLVCGFALLGGSSAFAQQTADQSGSQLEEVVVTAQKRVESLQDVPISLNVVGGDKLDAYNITEMRDISHYVPNLTVTRTAANDAISIRGVGANAGSLDFEQDVAIFVDGLYGGQAHQFQAPFLDDERIEVLRGPQGGLAGKNTESGAVMIVTRKPTDKFEADVTVGHEFELGGNDVTAIVSGPVSDKFKLRFAGKYEDDNGWMTNTGYPGKEEPSTRTGIGRLTVEFDPTDNLTITAKAELSRVYEAGCFSETKAPNDPLALTHVVDCPGFAPTGERDQDHTTSRLGEVTVDYRFGGGYTLTSITGVSAFLWHKLTDGTFTAPELDLARFGEKFSQESQEVRLTSPTDQKIDYVIGAYYHHNSQFTDRQSDFNWTAVGYTGDAIRDLDQDDQVGSTFAQATWHALDSVRVNGAVRYTYENKTGCLERTNLPTVPASYLSTSFCGDMKFNNVDPSANVQWNVLQSTMLFFTYTHGSKGGGFTGDSTSVTQANWEFLPETSYSLETGVKYDGKSVRGSLTLYRTRYFNQQVSILIPNTNQFVTENVASSQSLGFEAEGAWVPITNLTISGSLAYVQAKYLNYPNGQCRYPNPNYLVATCTQNLSGDLFDIPQWNGSVQVDYRHALTDRLTLLLGASSYFQSDTNRFMNPRCYEAGYAKMDARVGVEGGEAHPWELTLMGRNITNKWTFSGCFATPLITNDYSYYTEPPRTIELTLRVRY